MNIINRIISLRNLMKSERVEALIIYGTDPHLSEYVPTNWRSIEWISGFTGSYGRVVITQDQALLWTDSRYFIQAESQLKDTGFVLMKDRQADSISIGQWLKQKLESERTVAIDGLTLSASEANKLKEELDAKSIHLTITKDLVSPNWINRQILPQTLVIDYPIRFAGQSRTAKLKQIRKKLTDYQAEATLISLLDDLAWSFNLRGNEVKYNPVFTGYGYINQQQAILFINEEKIPATLCNILKSEGIDVINYESIWEVLSEKIPASVYLDPDHTNSLVYQFFSERTKVIDGLAIPTLLKSVKNSVEIAGMRSAHRRDGVAMVNFLYWLYKNTGKVDMTELSIAERLGAFRAEQKYFMDESFSPIVAFGLHGAIVHYSATAETDFRIGPDGILLIDTGGQYLDGTTDITRTVPIGKIHAQQRTDFTLVLKGMISIAKALFPSGTKGHSLDILARINLWDRGLNYGHGTGHGVGHYLCVHEGPVGIRPEFNRENIQNGQIITDEPGLYREGKYGIRIENVLLCKNKSLSVYGQFLSFETLTLCPIDRRLINRELLNNEEIKWLNSYHKRVYETLKSHLKSDVLKWLTKQCAPIPEI